MKALLLSLTIVIVPGLVLAKSAKTAGLELIYSCKPIEFPAEGNKNLENYADFEIVRNQDGKYYAYSPSNKLSDTIRGGNIYSKIPNYGFGRKKAFDMTPERLAERSLQVKVVELTGKQMAQVNTQIVKMLQSQKGEENFLDFYVKAMVVSTVDRTPTYLHPRHTGNLAFNDFMILDSMDRYYAPEVYMMSGNRKHIWKTHICDQVAQ